MATALFFAAHRWGVTQGIYNYTQQAQLLLDLFLTPTAISTSMFDSNSKNIVYNLWSSGADTTYSKYNMPAFYDLWA